MCRWGCDDSAVAGDSGGQTGFAEETPRGGSGGLTGRDGGLAGVAIIQPSLLTVVTKRGERRDGGAGGPSEGDGWAGW